jgi:hypothetical protein
MSSPPDSRPPPIVERIAGVVVWTTLLGLAAGPVLVILALSRVCILGLGGGCAANQFDRLRETLFFGGAPASDIVSNRAPADAQRPPARLRRLVAGLADIRQGKRALEIVILRFDRATGRGAPRPMHLDVSEATWRAAVVVADVPIDWTIATRGPGQKGFVGFEGTAPFEVSGAFEGLLSGFRIAAFGAEDVMRPADYADTPGADRRRICKAVGLWVARVGVPLGDVDLTVFDDAARLTVADRRVTSDGLPGGTISASAYCGNG